MIVFDATDDKAEFKRSKNKREKFENVSIIGLVSPSTIAYSKYSI